MLYSERRERAEGSVIHEDTCAAERHVSSEDYVRSRPAGVTHVASAQPQFWCHPSGRCEADTEESPVLRVRSRYKRVIRQACAQPRLRCHPQGTCAAVPGVFPEWLVRSRIAGGTR